MLSGDPPSSGPGHGRGSVGVSLAGPLAFSEALALHHDLVGVVGKPVEGALGEDRVVEERDIHSSMARLLVTIVEERRWRSRITS